MRISLLNYTQLHYTPLQCSPESLVGFSEHQKESFVIMPMYGIWLRPRFAVATSLFVCVCACESVYVRVNKCTTLHHTIEHTTYCHSIVISSSLTTHTHMHTHTHAHTLSLSLHTHTHTHLYSP
jgi:hypothetical protein